MDHAKKVLAAFGRAFGKLPEKRGETTEQQKMFLNDAMIGLAQEGKVISVRLALFAEMMKGKSWTPATLQEVGGTEGIGVTFLEETFSAGTAPPEHRYHQKAGRAVLKALLPETGTDIKGHMRSHEELLEASGYASRPRDFDDLLRILDSELRLITPTDPEGKDDSAPSTLQAGAKYYQLTHDYLVPSLRDWLTRKQKETRRGRAELLLADRAAVWNARTENRQLPSLLQWLQIRWLTKNKNWTPPQQRMMRKASLYHVLRGLLIATFLVLAGAGLMEAGFCINSSVLAEAIRSSDTAQLPQFLWAIEQMERRPPFPSRMLLLSKLRRIYDESEPRSRERLHASLALLPVDSTQADYLSDRLLDAQPHEFLVIRGALGRHEGIPRDKLWHVVEAPEKGKESQRLRAAAALARYDPVNEKWATVQEAVGNDLVAVPALHLSLWAEALRPVRTKLLPQLSTVYRDAGRRETERSLATDILADYAADNPQVLADLLLDADDQQFAAIYSKLKDRSEQGLQLLTEAINKKLPPGLLSSDKKREKLAKRQANAAVALLRMNHAQKVWPLLRRSDQPEDPRLRSYVIHRLAPLGADAGALIKRLDEEPDVTIRRALVLSLGEYNKHELSPDTRKTLVPKLQTLYCNEADPGLHAAVEWLLRQWKEEELWLSRVNDAWAKDKEQRDKRLASIQQSLRRDKEKAPPQWYVNAQGQTMVVIPGPVQFRMGSPSTEEGREAVESQHKRRIGRTFVLAAKSVTVSEFRRFLRANQLEAWFELGGEFTPEMQRRSLEENGPINCVDWYRAALYCNWLSEQDGIPPEQWCYETNAQSLSREKLSAAVLLLLQRHPLVAVGSSSYFSVDRPLQVTGLRKDYLSLTGYRLPMESEWEYACRAGAVTSWYYGETEELLHNYGWYMKNSGERTRPVGSKKPNDLGLFDMHGNVHTWCQERYLGDYPIARNGEALEDKEAIYSINIQNFPVLRGGSFNYYASRVRCAYRFWYVPSTRYANIGFRPARTYR
jgi:formylglycine-generating enzyme required for sulfatase activity